MTRREAREQAFLLLFEHSFRPEETLSEIVERAAEGRDMQVDLYAAAVSQKAVEHEQELDAQIQAHLKNWTMNRISRVSLVLLRLALCEMLYEPDVPVSVSINEAVELAKQYAPEDDASFINGVLGSVARAEALEQD